MSDLVRSKGKKTEQCTHCALLEDKIKNRFMNVFRKPENYHSDTKAGHLSRTPNHLDTNVDNKLTFYNKRKTGPNMHLG